MAGRSFVEVSYHCRSMLCNDIGLKVEYQQEKHLLRCAVVLMGGAIRD